MIDQIGARGLLNLQRPRQGNVAVEMALVEFVEDQRIDAFQLGVGQHLAQENPLGNVADPRGRRSDIVQAHPITHFTAELDAARLRHPGGQQAGRQAARLQHRHLAGAEQTAVEEHLRHLRRLARAGGRGQHQPFVRRQSLAQPLFDLEDR